MNLTYEEEKILKALGTGERQACTYKYLSFRTGINERELRRLVSKLVTDNHVPIATTSDGGYFLISNHDEFDHAHRELISRIKALSKRCRGLRIGYERDIKKAEQVSLF